MAAHSAPNPLTAATAVVDVRATAHGGETRVRDPAVVTTLAPATGTILDNGTDRYQRKWPDAKREELLARKSAFLKVLDPKERESFNATLPWAVNMTLGDRFRVYIQRMAPEFVSSILSNCCSGFKRKPRLLEIIANASCAFAMFVLFSIGTAYFVFLSSLSEQFTMTLSSVGCASRECTVENPCSIADLDALCNPAPISIQAPPSIYTPNSSLVEFSTNPTLQNSRGECIGVVNTLLSDFYVNYSRSQGFLGLVILYYFWCAYVMAKKFIYTETFLVAAHNRRLWSGPLQMTCGKRVNGLLDSFSWVALFFSFIFFGYKFPAIYNVYILDNAANRTTVDTYPSQFTLDPPEFLLCEGATAPLFLEYSYSFTATIGAIFAAAWAFAEGARSITDILTDRASWAKTEELLDRSKPEFDELLEYRQKTMCDEEIADYVLSANLHAIAKFRGKLAEEKRSAGAAPGEEGLPHFFDEHA